MIFDLMTYGMLASIFVVNTLRMFVEKPKNDLPAAQLPWERLLRRRRMLNSESNDL